MTGQRLLIGAIVMGVTVPSVLFFLLRLTSFSQWFTISATCFFCWGVADLTASILARPRLRDRSPGSAIKEWETSKREES